MQNYNTLPTDKQYLQMDSEYKKVGLDGVSQMGYTHYKNKCPCSPNKKPITPPLKPPNNNCWNFNPCTPGSVPNAFSPPYGDAFCDVPFNPGFNAAYRPPVMPMPCPPYQPCPPAPCPPCQPCPPAPCPPCQPFPPAPCPPCQPFPPAPCPPYQPFPPAPCPPYQPCTDGVALRLVISAYTAECGMLNMLEYMRCLNLPMHSLETIRFVGVLKRENICLLADIHREISQMPYPISPGVFNLQHNTFCYYARELKCVQIRLMEIYKRLRCLLPPCFNFKVKLLEENSFKALVCLEQLNSCC